MIVRNATNISDVKFAGSSVCGAVQDSTRAAFWGYGSTEITRVLSGSIALYKYGTGAVTLNATNTYTNGTFIGEGTLILKNNSGIGTTGNVTFTGGGLRYLTGVTRDISSRIKNSTASIDITLDTGATQTWTGVIDSSNTGGFTKRGSGQLGFSAAQTLTGPLVLLGGFGGQVYFQQPTNFTDVYVIGVGAGTQLAGTLRANGYGTGTIYFAQFGGIGFPESITWDSSQTAVGPMVISNPIVADMSKGRAHINFYGNKGVTYTGNVTITGAGTASALTTIAATSNSNQLVFASVPAAWSVGLVVVGTGIPYNTRITAVSGGTVTCSNLMSVASGTIVTAGSGDFVVANSQTGGSLLTFSGAVTSSTFGGSFSLRGGNVGSDGVFNGSLNAPLSGLVHNGVNWWTIFGNPVNNYSRLTAQNTAANAGFRFGEDNCIPPQALIAWQNLSQSSIDLNGKSATCCGISGTSGSANLANKLVNSSATTSTLTLSALATTRSFYGTITGPINIILNSSARTQAFYGSNGHTGYTQIIAGTLLVGSILSGTSGKFTSATFTSNTLAASFSVAPVSTDTFRLFGGSTTNTYASMTLTNGGGLTGYYNSSTSTIGFVPAPTSVSTGTPVATTTTLDIPVSANPNGTLAGSTAFASVEYGTSSALGLSTTPVSIGTGTSIATTTAAISGLTAGTTYHYRAKVTNSLWTVYSSTLTTNTSPVTDSFWYNTYFLQTFDGLNVGDTYSGANQAPVGSVTSSSNGLKVVASPSKFGKASSMDATATPNFVNFYNLVSLGIGAGVMSGAFTFEFSVYANSFEWLNDGSNSKVFEFLLDDDANPFVVMQYHLQAGLPSFYCGIKVNESGNFQDNAEYLSIPSATGWYEFAITRDAFKGIRIFINGVLAKSVVYQNWTCNLQNCTVRVYKNVLSNQYTLDDVRLSDVCRYTSNYTMYHPLPTIGSDPLWSSVSLLSNFDSETVGTQPFIFNNSKSGSSVALYRANYFGATPWTVVSSPSVSGNAVSGSGTGALDFQQTNGLNLGSNWTLEFSYRFSSSGGDQFRSIVNLTRGQADFLFLGYDSGLQRFVFKNSSSVLIQSTVQSLQVDTWYDVSLSSDSAGDTRMFINGVLCSGTVNDATPINAISIMKSGSGTDYVDEIRLTNACRHTSSYTPRHPFLTQ
jgi:autotransporter-associated beta strand protein